ncbi:hypothetical protein F3Y22_tig00111402pilonHSYRG01043 [Hibiscus syriacus]|uniref:RNase H type-1 domain-containing protein n=1 Tax=Hibiscus syriacus TaxID=106335 RepID=A0A6A2YA23_HIBSY|nr:hypothetical protein F3Y22_tig00111402pilonHSYRG01043 [Hibiscus syriacus]
MAKEMRELIIFYRSLLWANTYWSGAPKDLLRPPVFQIQWEPPPIGCFCLNTDRAVNMRHDSSAGGLIRSHDGGFITGFSRKLGTFTGNSSEAFELVTSASADNPLGLVRSIFDLLDKDWQVDFKLIWREANMAAYFLAKLHGGTDGDLHVFDSIPPAMSDLLARDM